MACFTLFIPHHELRLLVKIFSQKLLVQCWSTFTQIQELQKYEPRWICLKTKLKKFQLSPYCLLCENIFLIISHDEFSHMVRVSSFHSENSILNVLFFNFNFFSNCISSDVRPLNTLKDIHQLSYLSKTIKQIFIWKEVAVNWLTIRSPSSF